jgi:unsaturated rhamnogalacturonyl hydrolase
MKKIGFVIIILLWVCFCFSAFAQSNQLGDVNSNGTVDIVDALLIAQYYVGLNPSNFNQANADVNDSGGIDIVDALLVAQYYVGLIPGFGSTGPVDAEVCASAGDVAERIAYNLLNRNANDTHYATACAWHGTLLYAGLVNDSTLIDGSVDLYAPYLSGQRQPNTGHVDDNVFGIWPFGLYQQTNNSSYLTIAQNLADDEFNPPRSDGLCRYTRFWVDDLYMICSLQAQAYKALHETVYLDRCGVQFAAYFDELQQSNGLFHHTANAPFFWGRGNGWAASAMTEVLLNMPQSHSLYNLIMDAYKRTMDVLVDYQDSSGMWHQVITYPSSYLETSCTGMFLFAMSTGVRMGWLPENEYLPVIERGWRALATYVNANGEVSDICIGTGEGSNIDHYLNRPRSTGDLHGQAAVIWAAVGIMQLCN